MISMEHGESAPFAWIQADGELSTMSGPARSAAETGEVSGQHPRCVIGGI